MIPSHAWVVLLRDDGTKAIIRASKNSEVRSGHSRALGDQLVGHPYGSTFEFREDDASAVPPGPFKSLEHLNEKRARKQKNPLRYTRLVRVEATEDAFAVLKREDTPEAEGQNKDSEEAGDSQGKESAVQDGVDDKDNRAYIGDTKNQKADSVSLRNAGASGQEIVRALTENSVTFNMKTKFSQEKYLRRITQKHIPRVTVVRATSRTVAEVLFSKHQPSMASDSIRGLRWMDSLPQMLSYGNVHAAAKCLVLDGTSGLLSLSVLERLREDQGGRCFYVGTTPREVKFGGGRPFIDLLNIPRQTLASRFVVCSSTRLSNGRVQKGSLEEEEEVADDAKGDEEEMTAIAGDEPEIGKKAEEEEAQEQEKTDTAKPEEEEEAKPAAKRIRPTKTTDEEVALIKQIKTARKEEMFNLLDVANGGPGADSLLIAARQHPIEALEVLLPHLGYGRPFVVHHPCIEPLMVARAKLAEDKSYLDLVVTEAFCREYQVLPNRTHPMMNGSATGGFILRGIKVQPWKDQE